MARFFTTLNYSSVNEDWRTEARALRLAGGERVLCVCGSGARALDLLAAAPVRVVAIDCNPAQSALLALKRAAIETLDYEDYARFLGLWPAPAGSRSRTLQWLRPALPANVAGYWAARERTIARGVLYAGRWERFHRRLAGIVRLVHGRRVSTLLGFDELGAQREWVDRRWNDRSWRLSFELGCGSALVGAVFGDPAYRGRDAGPAGRFLHARMGALLRRVLARDSFMVALALSGVLPPQDLPPHLTEAGLRCLRGRLGQLEIVTAELTAFLSSPRGGRFDRFSLSDVGSFLEAPEFDRLLAGTVAAATPRARVVLRQFLRRHHVPAAVAPRLAREPQLEAGLAAEDRSFAYDFVVAEVRR